MRQFNLVSAGIILLFLLTNCSDNPVDSTNISKDGSLTYNVVQFANFSAPNPQVEVTYRTLADDLVVDTVQVPWSKTFDYSYSTTPDSLHDFKANLIVQYQGEYTVFLKARIKAEQIEDEYMLGKSFTRSLNNTLRLPK